MKTKLSVAAMIWAGVLPADVLRMRRPRALGLA